jgi:hypothetical protein
MLRLGIVCAIAAIVAAAVVLSFNPKQNVHHTAQVDAQPSSLTADNRTLPLVDSVRIVPALADAGSPIASTPPPQIPPAPSRRHPRRRSHRFHRRTNHREMSRRRRH